MRRTSRKKLSAVWLSASLARLDLLIEHAVEAADTSHGPASQASAYRGLHITAQDVTRLLAAEPGAPVLWTDGKSCVAKHPPVTDWIGRDIGLTGFDEDVLLLALAPEIDLKYEKLYGYLQDDITRKRPTVDLALNLLTSSAAEKLARRSRFLPHAPLLRHGLMHLAAEASPVPPPLLAHSLKIDDQILDAWLGEDGMDARLAGWCEWADVRSAGTVPVAAKNAAALAKAAMAAGKGLMLEFRGPHEAGSEDYAAAIARQAGAPLLAAALSRLDDRRAEMHEGATILVREARLRGAMLYVDATGADGAHNDALLASIAARAMEYGIVTVVAGHKGRARFGSVPVALEVPAASERAELWSAALKAEEISLDTRAVSIAASRLELLPVQIRQAARAAGAYATLRGGPGTAPELSDVLAAARAQCGHELAALAKRIRPVRRWEQLVAPPDVLDQLREICERIAMRDRVFDEWGFQARHASGRGVSALFAGPSGTGKTMAAEIIARELDLDLYRIDLAGIVSKYIGETEKNLDRVFAAAQSSNAVLFFDEADALFGKRSEVRDSHDRYANIEISYLLQKMEDFQGIAILATNLRQNLDESFVRRLAFQIHFPFPDDVSRLKIWQGVWPAETLLADDVDLASLARRFRLSGGNIRNVALAAAFAAAQNGEPVSMDHLLHGIRREYQKFGKTLGPAELLSEKAAAS